MLELNLPIVQTRQPDPYLGRWWTTESDGRILCQLCPRACRLKPGDRGFCFVRKNDGGRMVLDTYGRSTGFCMDPIEKKPLNHFLPGTPVLSFGTAGCNLGCKFCQNWDISKSREVDRLSDRASPEQIATAAKESGCRSVAFTYNDPVIWAEYAIDTAAACRQIGIQSVAVTAGYIMPEARREFFCSVDATNIDLKAFTEDFYFKLTGAHLDPVLDTIRYVVEETDCWVELTNLIIPRANDSTKELQRMCDWLLAAVGDQVPVHFTAFHPDFRMTDRARTDHETLIRAFDIAQHAGLKYVYVGNIHDVARQSTYCPACRHLVIERDWHQLGRYALNGNRCGHCGNEIAGRFETTPGDWGHKRQPIRIATQPTGAKSMSTTQSITPQHLPIIHRAACQAVEAVVRQTPLDAVETLGTLAGIPIYGLYVTLKRGETLRGCCGRQGSEIELAQALMDAATRTAKHDPRMAPIAAVELPYLNVSVSILGPPWPVDAEGDDRAEQIEIGKHGLRIQIGDRAGLLLPVVAKERNWSPRQFLDAVCTKANLPPGSWLRQDADLRAFDGMDYSAPMIMHAESAADSPMLETGMVSTDELAQLQDWVQSNIIAYQSGATPMFYTDRVGDPTVSGLALNVWPDPNGPPFGAMQFSIRDGFPLQSSLLQMTERAANALRQRTWKDGWKADVAVLSSPIHHGTDVDHDLREVDCAARALVAIDGRRWSIGYDSHGQPDRLLAETLRLQPFRTRATQIYSARCETTGRTFSISDGPTPQADVLIRSPAVAGTFYPAANNERMELVDQLFHRLPKVGRRRVAAAMVPHAGLHYSGSIAADVWRRIELPPTVLIISPKHTRNGVDWAVAPYDTWQLSESDSLVGDVDLARRIADTVPGMRLDAGAHEGEHGIEVQLPLLHRLAPQTKIAAIAMSGGTLDELHRAGEAIASLIGSLDQPPLLVISSDMNHFADDQENRRRDRMALDQLKRNDPDGLLETCRRENISMCGQGPAALVLLALRTMGVDAGYDEIAYDTSASTSGDWSRVVGYAGVLF